MLKKADLSEWYKNNKGLRRNQQEPLMLSSWTGIRKERNNHFFSIKNLPLQEKEQ